MAMSRPKMICYSTTPNTLMQEHPERVAELYDGFFFPVGSWDEGVTACIGVDEAPTQPDWIPEARKTVTALRGAGAEQNLLGVSFGSNAPWPSAETLLSEEYTEKMAAHYSALGAAARDLGFLGVSIDVEYCYKRYHLDHEIYTYEGYTAGDLKTAIRKQGRTIVSAVLNQFPEAVIFVIPGVLRGAKPLEREFQRGFLEAAAEKDAPGGMHIGAEFAYSLHDPVTQAAIPRVENAGMDVMLPPDLLNYWQKRCTVAPGVWPFHMMETGADDYPVRPWSEELEELRRQMGILRATSEKYIWSYTGAAAWLIPDDEIEVKPGRGAAAFEGAQEAVTGWHDILKSEIRETDNRMLDLFDQIRQFDAGEIDGRSLCTKFGTPPEWLVLGILGNPHTNPSRTAMHALDRPITPEEICFGRDGAVRWFPAATRDPRGIVDCRRIFDAIHIDNAAALLVTWVESPAEQEAVLNLGWDDGLQLWIGDNLVFDRPDYPEIGHGATWCDRYLFEEKTPVTIPAGRTRIAAHSINLHGTWQFQIRFTDVNGYPLKDLKFGIDSSK